MALSALSEPGMDTNAKSGDFYGPEQLTGLPSLLPPEPSLMDPVNIQVNREGCEAAVGTFIF